MKKLITLTFILSCFLNLHGQESPYYIVGPTNICGLSSATYVIEDALGQPYTGFTYAGVLIVNDSIASFEGSFPVTLNNLDSYEEDLSLLAIYGFPSGDPFFDIVFNIEVSSTVELITTGICAEDEETNCQQVCVGQTTQSTIPQTGGDLNWTIEGSEDYEINGNTASVTWNEAGEGLVEVSSDVIIAEEVFTINCQRYFNDMINIFVETSAYPIEIIVSTGSVSEIYEFTAPTAEGYFTVPEIPGEFEDMITVTNALGESESCSIQTQLGDCELDIFAISINSPTDCESCDGSIVIQNSGGGGTIYWNNLNPGSYNHTGLCPGIYDPTVFVSGVGLCFLPEIELTANNCSSAVPPLKFNAGFTSIGTSYRHISGGVYPYTITTTNPTGDSYEDVTSVVNNVLGFFFSAYLPGTYTHTIVDSQGTEITLLRSIPSEEFVANTSEIEVLGIDHADCGECNGQVVFGSFTNLLVQVYDGPFLVYEGTDNIIGDLCPAEYNFKLSIQDNPSIFYNFPVNIGSNCSQSTTCPTTATQCIQVLPNPQAQFITLPAAADNVVEICNEQNITFQNQSNGAESFIWDFGDFNTSVAANPEHTYANPGTYNVTCIARNDCFCSDTTSLTVNVLAADIPEIECVGTVCIGDTVTYTSPAECSIFAWQISAEGELIEGGDTSDDYIQVLWENGPVGTISLSVGGCGTNALCSQANVTQIPILSGDAVIEGPAKVCNSTQVIYSIPKYDGSDFQWTVSEFGTITSGENTHQITVLWEGDTPNNAQFVEVIYENCWLECGGNAQIDVSIVPEFYTQGVPLICENESSIYYARETANDSPASVNWTVLNAEGTSVFTASSSVSVEIPFEFGSGEYIIQTTSANINDYCTATYEFKVQVSELPDAPLSINGQSEICLGETYTYNAQSDIANPIFTWTINDSGNFSTQMGNTAVVTWEGTGTHLISATQTNANGLDCTSESITLNVETVESVAMSGTSTICAESTANYTATDVQGFSYDWSISPTNAGTIINGDNTNSVEIYWAYGGNATVNLQLCGQNLSQSVQVKELPIPQVTHPDYLCPDQMTTVSLTQNYQSYLWKDETGMTISTNPTVDLTSGYYEIEVTDADGCTGNSLFSIGDFSTNDLNISTPSFTAICPAAGVGFPILYAPELEEGFIYEWFFNNVSLGINATQIQTTDYGTYTVEATNPDGCIATSNEISITDACGQGPPAPPNGCNLTFSFQNAGDCKTFDFMPSSGNIISIVSWDFGDGNTSTEMNPQHNYDELGLYHIVLIANVVGNNGSPVTCLADLPLSFPVTADFGFEANCAGEAVQFNDISLTVGEGEIVSHTWDFGDPASGDNTSTETNPNHVFSAPGTYSISLTVTDVLGCSDEKIKTIEILTAPTVNFITPDQTCAATALPFTADVSTNVVNYTWDFGDPASGNANTAQSQNVWHNYENVGAYDVILTGSDVYGCEDAEMQTVVTEPNILTGDIAVSPANTICEGANVSLNAPEGGMNWQWSTGEIGESITVSEAGNYQVTLTAANGCTYIPVGQIIEVLPLPTGDIYAIELDEFGNPINYIFETHEVCFGEDVYLQIEENELYSYEWSTGSTTTEEEFSEDRDNLLEVGTTDISVTITDLLTGCSSISSYSVTVHPQPENIVISSDIPSPICGNSSANLSVESPDNDLNYIWNTGELGPQITLIAGGEYWVRAINEFGCEGESNHVIVENAPDIDKVPDGCHSICDADTLCLPVLENVAVYQWYFNGEILTTETANSPNLAMTEDGEYQLFMEDIYGCTSWSEPLNVEFYEGSGTVFGQVWLDVNENGIIDADDENLSGINIQITDENGLELDNISVDEGYYGFQNIPTTDYLLSLDTLSLPPDVTYTIIENTTTLAGCDDLETVDWLLLPYCAPLTATLEIPSCDGISVFYEGTEILVGESQNFNLIANNGCDSILTVSSYIFTPEMTAEDVQICEDETIEINGEILEVGDVADVVFLNEFDCDSIVTYTILSANSTPSTQEISICENETIEINGQNLVVGDITDILFTNQAGCDSIITYTVLSAASTPTNQTLQLCDGDSIQIEGTTVNAGEMVTIELTNQAGCDSIITISASILNLDMTFESVQICEGEIYEYQNTEMEVGEMQIFTLINQNGCDSLVEITVNAFTAPTFTTQSSIACPDINDGSFIIENPTGGTPPFEYSLDGNIWQTDAEFAELYSGTYVVKIRDDNNCIYDEEVEIPMAPDLVLVAEDQIFPCAEDELLLEIPVIGGIGLPSFTWNTGDTTATILIENAGLYSLVVTDGCFEQVADIEVVRDLRENNSIFYIPNAFSPNLDGVNDAFCPLSAADVQVLTYHLMIFDRWGNFVFESFDIDNCWEGVFREKTMDLDPAVFVYVLEAEVLVCEEQKSVLEYGDVTIVR